MGAGGGRWIAACLVLVASQLAGCEKRDGRHHHVVRINAAASIAPVIEAMSDEIQHELGLTVIINAGGSGMLAQQIARGDKVDLFICADAVWMQGLVAQQLTDPATQVDLASNRLVLIGLKDVGLQPEHIEDLADERYQPIAVGDRTYVPAGRYAAQVLESHGLGSGESLRLAEAPNVRAAVSFVLAGQCPVGLVYASDVRGSDALAIILDIDPVDHDPIRYPAAVMKAAPNQAGAHEVLAWLQGDKARAGFESAGFMTPEPNSDWRATQ